MVQTGSRDRDNFYFQSYADNLRAAKRGDMLASHTKSAHNGLINPECRACKEIQAKMEATRA